MLIDLVGCVHVLTRTHILNITDDGLKFAYSGPD